MTSSKLNWTIVRPPRLTDEEAIGNIRVFKSKQDGNAHRISRKDVATFMVDQLASNMYSKQAVTIATS